MRIPLMKTTLWLVISVFFLCSCQSIKNNDSSWYDNNGKLKILATTAMVGDLIYEVVGDTADISVLIGVGQDPHSYQLVKGDNEKIQQADVIFYNGLDLEHGPSLRHRLASSDNAYSFGDYLTHNFGHLILTAEGAYDPHIWMDMSLFSKCLSYIAQVLSDINPDMADYYNKRAHAKLQEMSQRHEEIRNLLAKIPDSKRYLVTSHDAFNYFTRAYLASDLELDNGGWEKRFEAPEGLAPDSQLSTYDIQYIIDHLRKYDVHVIFPESNVSKKSILKIQEAAHYLEHEIKISEVPLYGDSMGEPGSEGDTYEKMILHNAKAIYQEIGE